MEDLDLDAFIAGIEQTAPEQDQTSKLICRECNVQLEEAQDGNYVCPNCSAQATGILQLDDTELHHDDQGRAVYGQRVALTERKRKHQIDYGWAWSTDEAVAHILSLQIDALERAKLLPEFFRTAISNMWLKFWIENIAPHIKDTYGEDELIPISCKKAVKLRDIEVLVKVRDKVMVPLHLLQRRQNSKVIYKMFGSRFYATKPDDESNSDEAEETYKSVVDYSSSTDSSISLTNLELRQETNNDLRAQACNNPIEVNNIVGRIIEAEEQDDEADEGVENHHVLMNPSTKNISDESIAILTLNRTLAFIEATARCMNQHDPLFAADIIRACNQRLIPFYGASKLLPAGMNLNSLDKLMFQKTKPPTPIQLTRTASLLIYKLYQDQLPKTLPIPNLNTIIKRFIKDLNLPSELYDLIKNQYNFCNFPATRPMIFLPGVKRRLPQYDRWAFAVLLCQMKKLFNLSDKYIIYQSEKATKESRNKNGLYFDLGAWAKQLSIRLKLILRYDPFALYHPLTEVEKIECTPQMRKYIEMILDDRASSSIRIHPNQTKFDESYRTELNDFINRQLPIPNDVDSPILGEEELDKSTNIKYPITDAYIRTRRFWQHELESDAEISELVARDFTNSKLVLIEGVPNWCIYDKGASFSRWRPEISSSWPLVFRLLLNAGAFICFCDSLELMNEVRLVEESIIPQAKSMRRSNSIKNKK